MTLAHKRPLSSQTLSDSLAHTRAPAHPTATQTTPQHFSINPMSWGCLQSTCLLLKFARWGTATTFLLLFKTILSLLLYCCRAKVGSWPFNSHRGVGLVNQVMSGYIFQNAFFVKLSLCSLTVRTCYSVLLPLWSPYFSAHVRSNQQYLTLHTTPCLLHTIMVTWLVVFYTSNSNSEKPES